MTLAKAINMCDWEIEAPKWEAVVCLRSRCKAGIRSVRENLQHLSKSSNCRQVDAMGADPHLDGRVYASWTW